MAFDAEEEAAILAVLQQKRQWPAFQGTSSTIGLRGYRSMGFHEKRARPLTRLRVKGADHAPKMPGQLQALKAASAASREADRPTAARKKLRAERERIGAGGDASTSTTRIVVVDTSAPPPAQRAADGQEGDGDCSLHHLMSFGSVINRMDSVEGSVALSRMHSLLPPPLLAPTATKAKSAPQDAART